MNNYYYESKIRRLNMKAMREIVKRYISFLIVFAILSGLFPVSIFAEVVMAEETLTEVEIIANEKVEIEAAINNLQVSNETTENDILVVVQEAAINEVVVSWSGIDGFNKIDATADSTGSITGSLVLTFKDEIVEVSFNKIIEKLPSLDEEEVNKEVLLMSTDLMSTGANTISLPSTSIDNSSVSFVPGVYVGTNDTLTYNGTGTLTFIGGLQAAGIGGKGVNTGSNTVSADSFIGNVVFGEVRQVGGLKITA